MFLCGRKMSALPPKDKLRKIVSEWKNRKKPISLTNYQVATPICGAISAFSHPALRPD